VAGLRRVALRAGPSVDPRLNPSADILDPQVARPIVIRYAAID
jgi:hypothetical protein